MTAHDTHHTPPPPVAEMKTALERARTLVLQAARMRKKVVAMLDREKAELQMEAKIEEDEHKVEGGGKGGGREPEGKGKGEGGGTVAKPGDSSGGSGGGSGGGTGDSSSGAAEGNASVKNGNPQKDVTKQEVDVGKKPPTAPGWVR